ncbi:hypothetical protein GCM10009579_86280 [Streptomyces javensis]|uniref:Uncharacterized protein n=1 Tax=Streptomyces javensis TaxID=114698 RepID=A0ABN1XEZ9_9ACTN
MEGYRVRCTPATKLVTELVEAADEKKPSKTIARYGRVGTDSYRLATTGARAEGTRQGRLELRA